VDVVTSPTFGRIDMSKVRVTIGVLKFSRQIEEARKFARFVASDKGKAVFAEFGFSPAPQEEAASLMLYCGAGLRPPVSEIIEVFKRKTGITVQPDYSGGGVLVSKIKLRRKGDLFMPGDVYYIELAEKDNLIESKTPVCYLIPVILVRKGNPKNIRKLEDLARPGIKLGLCNPEACQIGRLCTQLFKKNGIDTNAIKKNLVFQSLTVNELGVQIKAGNIDATIVWDGIAAQYPDCADIVRIPRRQNIISFVAIAILKPSSNKKAAKKFIEFITSDEGRAIFKKYGYTTEMPE